MAKGEYTCKGCKKKLSPKGFFTGVSEKYKCSKHGEFCYDCVLRGFTGDSCPKCKGKAIKYEFKDSYGKWMKV